VLVLHDMLGITTGKVPRFVKNFLQAQTLSAPTNSTNATATTLSPSVAQAIADYVREVKAGSFPDNVLHGY
jgi:3-methyl-2-oxobutanoate hydroxymethyltransferase